MKLSILLLIIGLLQVSAKGYSQITLNEKHSSLEKVLLKIKEQTNYVFIYDETQLNVPEITIKVENASIEKALNTCFKDFHITYKIIGKNIILKQMENVDDKSIVENKSAFIKITGKITDEKGSGLSGVSIHNNVSKIFAISNKDGSYAINAEIGDILMFSFIGYQTQEVKIGSQTVYDVKMRVGLSTLDDIVVVGYGTTKRKDLTGSVASVNVNEIKDIPYTSIDQALSGKAAGVQVVQGDGSPGGVASIRIRGGTSILGGNDPLYIIDGVQITPQDRYIKTPGELPDPVARASSDAANTLSGAFSRGLNSLAGLNINDIATIDILKDASGTAIYGSKAANGVIIITTKKGKYDQNRSLN